MGKAARLPKTPKQAEQVLFDLDNVSSQDKDVLFERSLELIQFEKIMFIGFDTRVELDECVKFQKMSFDHYMREVKRIFQSTDRKEGMRLYNCLKQALVAVASKTQ